MERITCKECDRTFKGESGLEWHLRHVHSETGRDNQSGRACMAQVTSEPEPPFGEPPATPTEPTKPTEEKREVYISYVKAGS